MISVRIKNLSSIIKGYYRKKDLGNSGCLIIIAGKSPRVPPSVLDRMLVLMLKNNKLLVKGCWLLETGMVIGRWSFDFFATFIF
jgi:hypothetical protein